MPATKLICKWNMGPKKDKKDKERKSENKDTKVKEKNPSTPRSTRLRSKENKETPHPHQPSVSDFVTSTPRRKGKKGLSRQAREILSNLI